ncbi:hypothetical protein DFA_05116 [Cavenderia fasciculata]|uniref:Uncharacterized protein n=1 Tax=Cavenderia fasciculata TaxID=261658 RepID=F4PND3_CACFS|nr:uncharacterized protein DFA_05116 [Cavenderia fasciculata]EGG22986.1 hypothetical protein DFA_05116 [Cavenderia fasciculata]|eukprot:XP_004360837.1 hypothetical protein DFA_05116 [Cavenderia fasciculata]
MEKGIKKDMDLFYDLRMTSSPLGATMDQFREDQDSNKKEFVFLAYNDHALRFKNTKGNERLYVDKSFYSHGAHEKGILGWKNDGNNQRKGIIIQHSLPKWPVQTSHGGTFYPPYSTYTKDLEKVYSPASSNIPESADRRLSPYFGWNSFFGPNLMSYVPREKKGNEKSDVCHQYIS